jgi:ParB-like chromosome segregation protein Spo0J
MKINLIKPNPNNPRIIKDDKFKKLVQSIKDFPQMLELRPIVIDENNIVLGGNMRLKACQELGLKDVPTIFAKDLTEDQKKEFIIKDNVGFGEWNWDDLANDWDETKLVEWGLDLPVFNPNINDIEEVEEFNEAVIFQIKCDSIEELEKLQTKLNTSSKKIGYNEFIIKAGL